MKFELNINYNTFLFIILIAFFLSFYIYKVKEREYFTNYGEYGMWNDTGSFNIFQDIEYTSAESDISNNLIYKKADNRGFIYLNNPKLLDSVHGSSYNAFEFDSSQPNQEVAFYNSINDLNGKYEDISEYSINEIKQKRNNELN
jgi:hypothetical protein